VVCVEAPALALSGPDGQLRGLGWDGFYRDGVRALARFEVRLGGLEPIPLLGSSTSAGAARFLGALRIPGDPAPDPGVTVERLRQAAGRERITVHNIGGRPARFAFEVCLGSDLAPLAEVGNGERRPDLPGRVHAAGLRWSAAAPMPSGLPTAAAVTAVPSPHAVLASAGILRWDLELQPAGRWSVELTVQTQTAPGRAGALPRGRGAAAVPWSGLAARCDDERLPALLERALDELRGLLLVDPDHPADLYPASGAPWRFGLIPLDALQAARSLLPLGSTLAAGTLRALARRQSGVPDPAEGLLPGPVRQSGPGLPPACTATAAGLLFVTVLAEAWRWGLAAEQVEALLPTAERILARVRRAAGDGFLPEAQLAAPAAFGTGPRGEPAVRPPVRAVTQALAHRAALHGADLLDAFGRPGGGPWRAWAEALSERFRAAFWIDDLSGGMPAAALASDGSPSPGPGSAHAHLLDTGLAADGAILPGLLGSDQARTLARRLAVPDLDSGWGLRTLTAKSPWFSPLGHRSGAVRVDETALAAAGLAELGLERETGALIRGLLDAAQHFGGMLPEMYAGEQRTPVAPGPVPHPAACRPGAVASAAVVQLATALAGVRPDVPGGRVVVRPVSTAPLGELELSGLRVAGGPFSVRISRIGVAVVEEAPPGLQLGV
jgi:glycogen debranching enzyme